MRRGRAAFRSGNLVNTPEGEQGFWPSFADMMSSFALIMFFLMLIAYLQNIITGNNLISTQDKLAQTETTLASTQQQVQEAKDELALLTMDLDDAKQALVLQQEEMAEYAATISGQTVTIKEQEDQIASQKDYIALTTEELTRLRSQMQTIALLRLSVLDKIKKSIGATLGDESKVSIGGNGSIILSEGLLFDYNSASIKSASSPMLENLATAFTEFLSDPENAQYVDSIVISGHTDNSGGDARNRELSAERANAVLGYLLDNAKSSLKAYASYFCAAGYGSTRPVASNDTTAGKTANRRIEISIILKDETVLEIVDAYLASDTATSVTAAPAATPTPTQTPAIGSFGTPRS